MLASYVPGFIIRLFRRDPSPLDHPRLDRMPAAVMFADISGFTPLAEDLARRGPDGAETLSRILNDYFGRMVDLVVSHGGDVVLFAGDALLAVWPEEPLLAAACALEIQRQLHHYEVADARRLSVKIALGAGDAAIFHLGAAGRWRYLLAGEPLAQMVGAEHACPPGSVVVSPEAWARMRDGCQGDALPDGQALLSAVTRPPALPAVDLQLPPEAEPAVRAYLSPAEQARLEVGRAEWLAELRWVTVMFVSLQGLDLSAPDALDRLQDAFGAIQQTTSYYETSVHQFLVDDKGTVLMAVQGLPPLTHEDDPVRAVRAAMELEEKLSGRGLGARIGLASGRAFCGLVGNDRRRAHSVIGDVVNLAARLMQASSGRILCDEATFQTTRARVNFEGLPPIRVKGKSALVSVYSPLAAVQPERRLLPIIGRKVERAVLLQRLDAVAEGGVILIEGEAGIGKSRLVVELSEAARARNLWLLLGSCDAVERSTPYFAWRQVIESLLNLDRLPTAPLRREAVLERLPTDLVPLAATLNAVLPLEFPENDLTTGMGGRVRADNAHRLLVALLSKATAAQSVLVVLEDVHWLDSSSWEVALQASRDVRSLMLVLVTRPLEAPRPRAYEELLKSPAATRLPLDSLSPEEATALACRRLRVRSMPPQVADLIVAQAEGNPFFTEELAMSLQDTGAITVADGECRLNPDAADAFGVPHTIEGVVTSRIDRLPTEQQLTLKAASVIGRVFELRVLSDVHPVAEQRARQRDLVESLRERQFVLLEEPDPHLSYLFRHVITQQVAYNLMLSAQRRELHQAVAEWLERTRADELSSCYPLLAHHWTRAGVVSKAVAYLDLAGEQALHDGAFQEAVRFLSAADELQPERSGAAGGREEVRSAMPPLSGTDPEDEDVGRRARRHNRLGEAHLGLGDVGESRRHFERAVDRFGWPVPADGAGLAAGLLGEVARQAVHRGFRPTCTGMGAVSREAALETARAYRYLAEVYYFALEDVRILHASLRALNLSEAAGSIEECARNYGSVCVAAGVIPLPSVAESYARRALAASKKVGLAVVDAWVNLMVAIYWCGAGRFAEARRAAEQAAEISRRIDDRRRLQDTLGMLQVIAYFTGDLTRLSTLGAELVAEADRSGSMQARMWGENSLTTAQVATGGVERALLLEEANHAMLDVASANDRAIGSGLLALARWRNGEAARGAEMADQVVSLLQRVRPSAVGVVMGLNGACEATLAALEAEGSRRGATLDRAGALLSILERFARVFPAVRPHALLFAGLLDSLRGAHGRAHRRWRACLSLAEQREMRQVEGLAHYEIARHLPAASGDRRHHLTRARELFTAIGDLWHLSAMD